MSIRFRGSIIGNDPTPTTGGASGIYDLDAYTTYKSVSAWPAGVAGLYQTPTQAIFGPGNLFNVSNLVSSAGVIATDTGGMSSVRQQYGAAGYNLDQAVFAAGLNSSQTSVGTVNYITNTGGVGADVTNAAAAAGYWSGATFGLDKAIFTCYSVWITGAGTNRNTCMTLSNTGVWAQTSASTYYHTSGAAVGYGVDTALLAYGVSYTTSGGAGSTTVFRVCYVSNTGTISAESATSNSYLVGARQNGATRYGIDKGVFTDLYNTGSQVLIYITNTGVVGADQSITATRRQAHACTTYGGAAGTAMGAFGYDGVSAGLTTKFLISNTGVFAADSAGAGTARSGVAAAGFSLA